MTKSPGRAPTYPFRDLKIRQGFTVPHGEGMNLYNMRSYAAQRAQALGDDRRFKVTETAEGVRVERVADKPKTYAIT